MEKTSVSVGALNGFLPWGKSSGERTLCFVVSTEKDKSDEVMIYDVFHISPLPLISVVCFGCAFQRKRVSALHETTSSTGPFL